MVHKKMKGVYSLPELIKPNNIGNKSVLIVEEEIKKCEVFNPVFQELNHGQLTCCVVPVVFFGLEGSAYPIYGTPFEPRLLIS